MVRTTWLCSGVEIDRIGEKYYTNLYFKKKVSKRMKHKPFKGNGSVELYNKCQKHLDAIIYEMTESYMECTKVPSY